MQKWEPRICMSKPEVTKVPLWVKIYNVPLEAWNVEGISRIASRIGNPIFMDRITTDMCERSYYRASFTRVLVEVDSTKGLVDIVEVWYRSLGKSMMLDVEYVWRPPICEHCKIFGHTLKSCRAKDLTEEEKILNESMKPVKAAKVCVDSNNVGWQSARYRRNVYGRGGFSNNGRGSFGGGKGGYINNGGRGNGVSKQYVLVKTNERYVINKDGVFKYDKKDQYSNDSANKVSDTTVIRSGSASGSNSKETKTVDVLPSKNRFSALNDENDTNEEEKGSWSDQILDYYLKRWKKCNDKVLTPEEVLKSRIDLLQKQIVGGNKGLKETATKSSNWRIVDKCNEEMIKYYEGACEDIRSDKINGHLDDVVDGSNATVNFMANDEVSNLHDESMAEVQGVIETQLRKKFVNPVCNELFGSWSWVSNTVDSRKGCRIAMGDIVCFFVYAENTEKGRKRLWKNLVDHKSLAGDSPWVLLGDFNIKKRKDPNLGILKKLDRIMGNGDFMPVFDRSYANFLPYMTSDHCPVILVFPKVHCSKPKSFRFLNFLADKDNFLPTIRDNWNVDIKGFSMFVLAKRLKNMKKHMRRLNKCNGNVFVKSKFLNTELERFQRSLDKDTLNVLLREEDMIYLKAYSDAVPDEERLMKVSKSKIEVVSGDAGNTFYGDEISTKFVKHFENFLGADDHVFPIEDCNGLSTKKLDSLIASFMICLVLDEEIKAAMFGIKYDKAAGLDGFTSKFFKKSWAIVGPDLKVPKKLSDYIRITCCNMVYKCISEVLTNRLKEGLDVLVDINQCAFIPGRHISDNILLTQELMAGYDWNSRTSNCAFKVDIKKAKRGLRQGDLISPYLFTLVMEVLNLMIKGKISIDKRFKFHTGCKSLGLINLCFADDLLLLCHGDLISTCILQRGLDEFSSNFSRVLIDNVKKRIFDWKNKYLSYAGKLQLIASVMSSLNVYWASMFVLPSHICSSIDKILKDFCGALMRVGGVLLVLLGRIYVLLKLVSKKDSLWVKWVISYRLKGKYIWSLSMSDNAAWCWRNILKLRDKIRDFVGSKIGNGKSSFIWFDKWHSNGPLCKLITRSLLLSKGFEVNDKIVDRIRNNKWTWPSDWSRNFKDVLNVSVPVLNDLEDKTIWFNKKFEEVDFSVKEVCSVLRVDIPSVLLKTQDRLSKWFPLNNSLCPLFKILAKLDGVSNVWSEVVSGVCIKKVSNFIWSIIRRLVFGAIVYFICHERNLRLFGSKSRTVDVFLNLISNTVRLKLLSLNIKWSRDVGIAAKVWFSLLFLVFKGTIDSGSAVIWTGFWSCTYDEDINNGMVFYDGFCGNVVSMIIVIYLSLTWPYFLCLDDGSVWDWYGDGVGFEVKICLRKFIFEHYDFSVLIVGLDSCFVICSLWCFKLFGQICEFLWWLEEYQKVVLHDDLNCYVDCINWHDISKKVQMSVVLFFPPFSLLLASMCGDVSMYVGWS
ncbi:RNA-directed DNA polymerase, eukaryota, reverse transcriptase zinc-binding domain protein [Tanacetum coccineum]